MFFYSKKQFSLVGKKQNNIIEKSVCVTWTLSAQRFACATLRQVRIGAPPFFRFLFFALCLLVHYNSLVSPSSSFVFCSVVLLWSVHWCWSVRAWNWSISSETLRCPSPLRFTSSAACIQNKKQQQREHTRNEKKNEKKERLD